MPIVEDSTGFTVSPVGCKHPILFFGSGGYYVICSQCSYMWVARDPFGSGDQPDPNFVAPGLTALDKRVEIPDSIEIDFECEHERVFAPYTLSSFPPLFPWICRKCGYRGADRGTSIDYNEYYFLDKKFPS
jgi:hypothetical protein